MMQKFKCVMFQNLKLWLTVFIKIVCKLCLTFLMPICRLIIEYLQRVFYYCLPDPLFNMAVVYLVVEFHSPLLMSEETIAVLTTYLGLMLLLHCCSWYVLEKFKMLHNFCIVLPFAHSNVKELIYIQRADGCKRRGQGGHSPPILTNLGWAN